MVRRSILWACGGLVVVPLDAMHVTSGTIPQRAAGLEVAIPLFIAGAVVVGMLHRHVALPLTRALTRAAPAPSTGTAAAVAAAAFLGAYLSSSFVASLPPFAVLAAYVYAWLFIVATTPKSALPSLLLMSLGAAVVGPAFEGYFASTGAFRYAHPDVYNVPAWLPGVYLLAGAATNVVDRWLLTTSLDPTAALVRVRALLRSA